MRIEFSAKAWMLSVATGLAFVPTLEAEAWPDADETRAVVTAHAEDAVTTKKDTSKRHNSFLSRIFNRTEPTVTEAQPHKPLEVSVTVQPVSAPARKIEQVSAASEQAIGSTNSEPGRLSAQPATRDAISQSKPARQSILSRLFGSKTKSQPATRSTTKKTAKKIPASRSGAMVASSTPKTQSTSKPSDGKSEVHRQLEEMYRRNGRQMPSFLDGANKVASQPQKTTSPSVTPQSQIEVVGAKTNSAAPAGKPPVAPKTQQVAAANETNKASQIATTTEDASKEKKDPAVRQVAGPLSRFFGRLRGSRNPNDERPKHVERMSPADRAAQQRLHQGQTPEREYLPQNPKPIAPIGIIPPAPAAAVKPVAPAIDKPTIDKPAIDKPAIEQPAAPIVETPEPAPAKPTLEPVLEPVLEPTPPKLPEFSPTVELPSETVSGSAPADASVPADQNPFESTLNKAFPDASEPEADKAAPMPVDEPEAVETPEAPKVTAESDKAEATTPTEAAPGEAPLLPEPNEFSGAEDAKPAADQLPEIEAADKPAPKDGNEEKLNRIAQRSELMGLKGFCPVVLRDERDLRDASPEFSSEFEGQKYNFSSDQARKKFEANPVTYAPAAGGMDVVVSAEKDSDADGTLDNAVWFKDRLYLFSTKETLELFVISPEKYSIKDSKE